MQGLSKYILILTVLSGSLFPLSLHSQNASSSPYSRYAIGDLLFSGYARNLGTGGTGLAMRFPLSLNPLNPASYSAILFTTYEAGINAQINEISTSGLTQKGNNAALAYFALGYPVISKKWGMGFGLQPYSQVGYAMEEKREINLAIPETHTFKGSGGLNQFYLSNGFSVLKNLSAGVTVSYLFGVINQDRRVEFKDPAYFNTNISHSNSLGWFHFNLGLQYVFDSLRLAPSDSLKQIDSQINQEKDSMNELKRRIDLLPPGEERNALYRDKIIRDSSIAELRNSRSLVKIRNTKSDWDLNLGLTLAPASDLRGRQSILAYNFKYLNSDTRDQISVRDTILDSEGAKGKIKLPLSAGLGLAMKKGNRWLFGADFSVQQWSDFAFFGQPDSLVDSWRISVGGQFTPNERALKSYAKQIQYRVGIHHAKSFLEFNGTRIEESGVSVGFGFPIRRAGTQVHLAAEAGKRGTTDANLVEEKYLRFTLGFTLNDRWFIKPKYD